MVVPSLIELGPHDIDAKVLAWFLTVRFAVTIPLDATAILCFCLTGAFVPDHFNVHLIAAFSGRPGTLAGEHVLSLVPCCTHEVRRKTSNNNSTRGFCKKTVALYFKAVRPSLPSGT